MQLIETDVTANEVIDDAFKVINRLADRGKLVNARRRCELLYAQYPLHPRVMHGMGLLKYRTGDLQEGEELIRSALDKHPDFVGAHENLGRILCYSLNFEGAEHQYRKVLELDPDNVKAMESLATVLTHREKYQEALALCYRILVQNPKSVSAYTTYGHVMMSFGRPLDGVNYLQKALALKKESASHSGLLFMLNLLTGMSQQEIYEESKRWGQLHTKRLTDDARRNFNYPAPQRKLRIGYVSGDFRKHPVGYHLRPVLAAHDKSRFEIFMYNAFPNCDAMTEEFAGHAVCYRNISLKPDEKVESLIREDGIDILVDLAGHTAFNRLLLFARRPAPVQVSWIGYFNTTGMPAMDYFVSDPITTPASDDAYFSEKILRLPDVRFCYEPQPYAPDVAALPALRNGYITFGSFNAIHKMLPEVLALWSQVLHAVPGSRLLLKSKSFKEEEVKEDFVGRFAALGISEDRLELRTASPHEQMLAEYGDMDISLDTFPYNGGATTCESLWMGVPVITLAGATPIGRQTKAYLHAIGYPGWTATTEDEFVAIAVDLASDLNQLAAVRASLRAGMADSPVCDGVKFTRHLESEYRSIWTEWCSRQSNHMDRLPYATRSYTTDELCAIGFNYIKDHQPILAGQAFRRVLRRDHSHLHGLNGAAVAAEAVGDRHGALRCFRRALRVRSDEPETCYNLGCFYIDQRQYRKAIRSLRLAVTAKTDYPSAWLNLGIAYNLSSKSEEACDAFRKVLELDPDNLIARRQLVGVLASTGDVDRAIREIQEVLQKKPDEIESLCFYLHLLSYVDTSTQEEIYRVSTKVGMHFASLAEQPMQPPSSEALGAKTRLRIGFVSNDFKSHPIGLLLIPFFLAHNPSRLELYCYNNGLDRDHLTSSLQAKAAAWREIADLTDDEVADIIRHDHIDILIDLNGYTHRHRLQLFARRPAPVQASWIGYWHTTGLREMDYFIADEDLVLPEDEKWFSEKIVRLPDNRFCFLPSEPYPEVVEPPYLTNGYITFGCFGNPAKITTRVVQTWADMLQAVPASRLVLKYKTYRDKAVRRHFVDMFRACGIPATRIEFRPSSTFYMMMLEFGDLDICLDTFPFTGGMTSLHALCMGVPVVTQAGEMPVSRQTQSFLKHVGLSDLVAHSSAEFRDLAVALAHDRGRLAAIRMELRDRMLCSPLCDVERYARNVERLLFDIWADAAGRFSTNG